MSAPAPAVDLLGLAGRRCLVTGGTRGIGRAVVHALLDAGASVLTCHRGDAAAAVALAESTDVPQRLRVVRADLTVPADRELLAAACREEFGGLDVLVNNAAVDGGTPFAGMSDAEWRRVVDADLTAVAATTRAVLPLLGPGASVVTVGAALALRGAPGRSHYAAAKAGLLGFARALTKELGPTGIRVNTVAPGPVASPGEEPPPPLAARLRAMAALGRQATPDEVADVVLFLAGRLSGYVTGTVVHVDGGI
ncbi:SDR family NAD(P)-dependent oxidoreductase [Micromonospora coerulea]|uniref:SDR family NAD(P)-dependent oxidoreductase n=1 Tax=Micromonospora coerulea TaxID=47856 RepID=UPI0019065745|nr:SDR family oxidoreductase [Micromonospora veneta]